jgi:hypothetical protein
LRELGLGAHAGEEGGESAAAATAAAAAAAAPTWPDLCAAAASHAAELHGIHAESLPLPFSHRLSTSLSSALRYHLKCALRKSSKEGKTRPCGRLRALLQCLEEMPPAVAPALEMEEGEGARGPALHSLAVIGLYCLFARKK